MQILDRLNQYSGAIIVLLTIAYVCATLAIVLSSSRANQLTRENINLLVKLEEERMRPQLYFDLFFDNGRLVAKLKNYGATAAFDINISLEPKVMKVFGGRNEELKLTSSTIACIPPQKEIEEFIDVFSQFMGRYKTLKFDGRIEYRGETPGQNYDQNISIDLSVHQVAIIFEKNAADEIAKVADRLQELVQAKNDQ